MAWHDPNRANPLILEEVSRALLGWRLGYPSNNLQVFQVYEKTFPLLTVESHRLTLR
jgi:hypothetical protein